MDKQLFFGYGANKNRGKIKQIIGKDPGEEVGAILEGYILCVQKIEDIPSPVKEELTDIFGNTFKAYTIKKGDGIVAGTIWSFTEDELQKIKDWEYVGVWREIIKVKVKTEDLYSVEVLTEKSLDQIPSEDIVDGISYNEFGFIEKAQGPSEEQEKYYSEQQLEKIKEQLKREIKSSPTSK